MTTDWLAAPWTAGDAAAVMTTRAGGASRAPWDSLNLGDHVGDDAAAVAANRAAFAARLGAAPVWLHQVHGARVVHVGVEDARPGAPVHEADASVTTQRGVACAVLVADCLPVLLAAPAGRGVAAAHAGWRGLAGGVVDAAVAALCEAAGCAPGELRAWLGASIGPRRFEVGADVLQAFGASPVDGASPSHFVAAPPRDGVPRWRADLPALARARLHALGVRDVSVAGACTVEDGSRFFSFRRDGVCGRMAAAVWLR